MPPKKFHKGDKIEVRNNTNDVVLWHPATFLRSSPTQMHVQYDVVNDDGVRYSSRRRDHVSIDDVRPAPPTELHRYFRAGEKVEAFCTEKHGWRKGLVLEVLENSRYTVSFNGSEEGQIGHFVEVEQWMLRAVREWLGGEWVPPFCHIFQKSSASEVESRGLILKIKYCERGCEVKYNEGMLVEIKSDEDGFRGSWYDAVIVEPLGNDNFLVEYRTLTTEDKTELLKEEVHISCIRPSPPITQRIEPFHYLEQVDAWYNDGWWEGHIVRDIHGCKYVVSFNHEEMVFEHCKLRPRQEWNNGKWSAASKVNLASENFKSRETKLKRKCRGRNSESTFRDGMVVEVKSDEEGYLGSWYSAVIISSLSSDSFLVEYQTLKIDDESEFLRESVFTYNMRPFPPKSLNIESFKTLEEVDAWYNEGWWVGVVSKVLGGLKYAVYFWTTNEELVFEQFNMRPHQEWIGGKWINVSSRKRSKLLLNTELQKSKVQSGGMEVGSIFINGMKVEVRSDEEGYRGSWYPATIVKPLRSRKYLVKYQTLENDDGTELLKEEAASACIRPCPPIIQTNDEYKPFEEVDVWYNDGWWVGQICKVLEGKKYTVYFSSTNEILEFEHSDLRPHQDWINGQWVLAKRGRISFSK